VVVLENYFINPIATLLNADQRGYVFLSINNTARITLRLIGLIYLYFGGNIFIFLSYTYLSLIVTIYFLNRYKARHYAFLNTSDPADTSALKMTKDVLVHKLATLVVYNTDTIILAFFLSLRDASVFAVYGALYNVFLKNALYTIFSSITPSLGNLLLESNDKSSRVVSVFETLVFIISTAGFLSLFYIQFPLISFISKPDYSDHMLGILFLLMCYLDIIRTPALIITAARGLFAQTKIAPLMEAGLNLTLSLILVQYLGIYGVVLATVITYCVYLLIYYPLVYRISGFPLSRVFLKIGVNLVPVFLAIFLKFSIPADASIQHFLYSAILATPGIFALLIALNFLLFRSDVKGIFLLIKNRGLPVALPPLSPKN
jgi:O-antigen/teichoic acid export membrane protein